VALVVDDIVSFQPWKVRGVDIRGEAELLTGPYELGPHFSEQLIRVVPQKIHSWGPDQPGAVPRVMVSGQPAHEADRAAAGCPGQPDTPSAKAAERRADTTPTPPGPRATRQRTGRPKTATERHRPPRRARRAG
jgi:hypothetical protein